MTNGAKRTIEPAADSQWPIEWRCEGNSAQSQSKSESLCTNHKVFQCSQWHRGPMIYPPMVCQESIFAPMTSREDLIGVG